MRQKLLRSLRTLASAGVAAGLMALALKLGEVPEVQAAPYSAPRLYAEGEMPSYPNVLEFPLGDGLKINGVPIRASYFTTDKPAEEVRDFYREAFKKKGLFVRETTSKEGFTVTGAAGGAFATSSVIITRSGSGAQVFPAILPVEASPLRLLPGEDVDVPFTKDSIGVLDVGSTGIGGGRNVVYQEMQKISVVEPRLTSDMQKRGWRLADRREIKDGLALQFRKGARRAFVAMQAYSGGMEGTGLAFQFDQEEDLQE
jgi:hypothetical protein